MGGLDDEDDDIDEGCSGDGGSEEIGVKGLRGEEGAAGSTSGRLELSPPLFVLWSDCERYTAHKTA